MPLTVKDFLDALDRLAHCDGGRGGDDRIQVGSPAAKVRRVAFALAAEPRIAQTVRRRQVDLLIVCEPLFDPPLAGLRTDQARGETAAILVGAGCSLLACRRNLDVSPLGPAQIIADALDLADQKFLRETVLTPGDEVKFAVFVPMGHEAAIIDAIAKSGGGVIGNYSHCTFRSAGTGTYRPLEGADPWVGEIGKLESAKEVRLEARVSRSCVGEMLARVGEAHPYDEMAYDIYPLETPMESPYATGVVGRLARTTTLKTLATRLQRGIPLESPPITIGGRDLRFDSVAIHSGNKPARLSEIARPGVAAVISENLEQPPIAALSSPGIGALLCDYEIPRARAMKDLADSLADSLPLRKHKVEMDRTILLERV